MTYLDNIERACLPSYLILYVRCWISVWCLCFDFFSIWVFWWYKLALVLFIYCIFCVFYWRKCFYLFLCLVLLAESAWRLNQGFLQISMTNTDLSSQTFLLMKLMLTHDFLFSKKKKKVCFFLLAFSVFFLLLCKALLLYYRNTHTEWNDI